MRKQSAAVPLLFIDGSLPHLEFNFYTNGCVFTVREINTGGEQVAAKKLLFENVEVHRIEKLKPAPACSPVVLTSPPGEVSYEWLARPASRAPLREFVFNPAQRFV